MRGGLFNVDLSEANISKAQLGERIARHVPGFVRKVLSVRTPTSLRGVQRELGKLGWRPDVTLDARIEELVKGFRMLRNGRFADV